MFVQYREKGQSVFGTQLAICISKENCTLERSSLFKIYNSGPAKFQPPGALDVSEPDV